MPPDTRDSAYRFDMLAFARDAASVRGGHGRADLDNDLEFRLAAERAVERIGEAARRITMPTRVTHATIPWRTIIGLRNIVAHEYGRIDYDVIWNVLSNNVPALIAALEPIVAALPPPE